MLVYLDLYFKAFHLCWSCSCLPGWMYSVASFPGHVGGEHVAWEWAYPERRLQLSSVSEYCRCQQQHLRAVFWWVPSMCHKVDPTSGYRGINDADGHRWNMWYFCTEVCGTFVLMATEWNIQHLAVFLHDIMQSRSTAFLHATGLNNTYLIYKLLEREKWSLCHISSSSVFGLHRRESSLILRAGFIRAGYDYPLFTISPSLVMFIVASAFVGTGGTLSPRKVFTTLSLVWSMRETLMFLLVRAIFMLYEGRVAGTRIQVRQVVQVL